MKKKEIIKQTQPVKAARQASPVKPLKVPKATKAEKPAARVAVTKSAEASKVGSSPVKPAAKAAPLRPAEIPLAIQKLLDTTNHIQARAAELENALDAWHEHERSRAVKDFLTALRNSPDGDLLRFDPGAADAGPLPAFLAALTEAFSIEPVYEQGERIPVRPDEIPDSLELDRSIDQETGECMEVEVVSAGWKLKEQVLIKPVVRPLFRSGK